MAGIQKGDKSPFCIISASAEKTKKVFVILDESHRLRLTPYFVPPRSFDLETDQDPTKTPRGKFPAAHVHTDDHRVER